MKRNLHYADVVLTLLILIQIATLFTLLTPAIGHTPLDPNAELERLLYLLVYRHLLPMIALLFTMWRTPYLVRSFRCLCSPVFKEELSHG